MATTELTIEVDEFVLKKANEVFQELSLDMSTAINIYLTQVWISHDIPFPADLDRARILDAEVYSMEQGSREAVRKAIAEAKANGHPIGRYDSELKKAYLEYPDGRRDYEFSK